MQDPTKSKRGFTLIELMVTIGLLTILAVVGLSGFAKTSGWLARVRLKAAAREMAMNFQYARMEAIKRNTFCTVVFNQPIGSTTYTYVIFPEERTSRNLVYNAGTDTPPLKRVQLSDYTDVSPDTTQGGGTGFDFAVNSPDGRPAFCFDQKGLPRRGNANTRGGGTVFLKDPYGNRMRIVVNPAGQIRIQ
ncbi:MAG: GspH/FimT family pseudopilin [Syntrophobacteraceae bacterium]